MTPEQIALVKSSFAKVVPIAPQAADLFYGRLFETAPQVRAMFPQDMSEQKKKLVAMLSLAVNGLDHVDKLVPALHELGRRHIAYGTTADQYPIVGGALLWTLRTGLGDEFTPEVEAAWTAAYALLSQTMIDGAEKAKAA
jgi:nitric oxide dioxygenase